MSVQAPLLTLSDWRRAYAAGAAPRRLIGEVVQRIAARGSDPAWIYRAGAADVDSQLAALDALLAQAPRLQALLRDKPLFGVPFAVKDNIDVAGAPTTAACPAYTRRPARHASAVQRLIDAGAVWVGKTNLDQFATGLVGTRSPYGRPASSFDPQRVSGGSSSGSAVVVARGDVPFALGTDTAGSGRVPAGFNNIVGHKPTPGRVSTQGVVPACRSIDCVSVFALTVQDAAAVLALMEGADPDDAYSRFVPGPARLPERLRIGVPVSPALEPEYADAWRLALQAAARMGHEMVPIDFAPLHAVAQLLYGGPWVAERHAAVQELLESQPEAFDPTVRGVIEAALGCSATEAFRGQYTLRAAQRDTAGLWRQVDLLMVPTAPAHPRFSEVDADPVGANTRLGTYTNFVNLLGWCALALPAGFTAAGLPFGATFIAPANADAALARFGAAWQALRALPLGATGAPWPAPETAGGLPWPAAEATLAIAVVGAHLSGLPLNGQLTERGAHLRESTRTTASYRLYALPGTTPPKPALQRVAAGGAAIEVEVWEMPMQQVGSFLALVPAPLGLGSLELADGRWVHGFVCEAHALAAATDITAFGGWRAYLAILQAGKTAPAARAAA